MLPSGNIKDPSEEGFGILTEADGSVRQGYWANGELVE